LFGQNLVDLKSPVSKFNNGGCHLKVLVSLKGFLEVAAHDTQRSRIYAGMELEVLSAGTVAKFIIKSSWLLLSLNRVFSA
jgi:hypothetical protein